MGWVISFATGDLKAFPGPFNGDWNWPVFCKSPLQLHDFISSRLNEGIFSIITVTKQTTDMSAFRRTKVSG